MYIPPMSDSSLWLLSKALDSWEIIILKSAPTLHLIHYAMFETLFFIRFGSFSMFIDRDCIKRHFSSTLCSFLFFCVAIVIAEPFSAGAYFRPDFAAIGRKKFAARYFWFKAKLKQKKFIFKQHSVTSTWEIKISRFYFLSQKSSVVSLAQGLLTI